jgi:hypothetical protein
MSSAVEILPEQDQIVGHDRARYLLDRTGASRVKAEHGGQFVDRPLAGVRPESGVPGEGPRHLLVDGGIAVSAGQTPAG